ncbi:MULTISPECIES: hypothetical protein [Amycolatopsis]|uniref:Uncharacterized protein n=1 Tax=Amycolatopsis dendrobii TaxID=2760662 RepID=A0A7W3W483_9PSEU|nr:MULTISPECIES: hypothetical protein [Amycolatopsis]MBB1158062.1 hypothetical protein [Amycolatopsis dendrobii]UKD57144.1 hypothetical protein L3Q65_10595 [Amycolatopsis sp. FU40]
MASKRITIGTQMWKVDADRAASVETTLEAAMTEGKAVRLTLLTGDDKPVTVLFNGKTAPLAVIDDGTVPRPTEISGSQDS